MAKHSVTAIFDDRTRAELAAMDLRVFGVPESDVTLLPAVGGSGTSTGGGQNREELWAALEDLFTGADDRETYAEGLRRGGTMVSVRADDDRLDSVVDILERHGSVDLDERETTWRREGWTGRSGLDAASPDLTAGGATASGDGGRLPVAAARAASDTLEVVEERLAVGKRAVSGGRVRIRASVVEKEASAEVTLRREAVMMERNPVERPVTAGELGADPFAERMIEFEEVEERAVVTKTAYVVEEIALRRDVTERVETVRDSVRSTRVDIEDGTRAPSGSAADVTDRIRSDMAVVGSDGAPIGTVDHMEGGKIKLKKDPSVSDGTHHYLLPSLVRSLEGRTITLAVTAAEAKTCWTSVA